MASATPVLPAIERFAREERVVKRTLILLRQTTTATEFLPCLSVSRAWGTWAAKIQYTAIVLDNVNLERFIRGTRVRDSSLYSTQSVTVHIDTGLKKPQYVDAVTATELSELNFVMAQRMPRLSTFSFCIRDEYPGAEPMSEDLLFGGSRFRLLLDYLPKTIVNLEIDSSGLESLVEDEDDHSCPLIAKKMPNMQHLRLRMRQLCTQLVKLPPDVPCADSPDQLQETQAPHLRSLVINMELSNPGCPATIRCNPKPRSPEDLDPPGSEFLREREEVTPEPIYVGSLHTELKDHLRDGYFKKKCFPALESLMVNDIVVQGDWHAMRQADLRQTQTLLHRYVITPEPSIRHHWTERGSWRRVNGAMGEELAGSCALIRDHLEGWETTDEGTRLPASMVPEGFQVFFANDGHVEDPEDVRHLPRLKLRRASGGVMDFSGYARRASLARPRTDRSSEIPSPESSSDSSTPSDDPFSPPETLEDIFHRDLW